MRSLLLLGADTEAGKKIGKTALHLAARYGAIDCLKLLLNAGAQRESQDVDQRTPLFEAAEYKQLACMRTLILAGVQNDVKDKYNKEPSGLGYFLYHSSLEKQADSSVNLEANTRSKNNNDDDAE